MAIFTAEKQQNMRLLTGVAVLFMTACATPEERFLRLQLDFMADRPPAEVFEIIAENDTVRWPLPPSAEYAGALKAFAESYREKARAIDPGQLAPDKQEDLRRFQVALDSICARTERAQCDPADYTLHAVLSHFAGSKNLRHPALMVRVVAQIPLYYARVQQRWTTPAPGAIPRAVEQSQETLDQLEHIERNLPELSAAYREQLQRTIPPARAAVKDFIGLCQSGLLEVR